MGTILLPQSSNFRTPMNAFLSRLTLPIRVHARAALLATIFLMDFSTAEAAIRVWTGNGAGANWSTQENWVENAPPRSGDRVVFLNRTNRVYNVADIVGLRLESMLILGGDYVIAGNTLVLSNGLVFDPPFAVDKATLVAPITIDVSQTIRANRGELTLNAPLRLVSPTNQTGLSAGPGARVVVSGRILGTNNVLVTGGGEVQFDNLSISGFGGRVRVESATAVFEGSNAHSEDFDLEIGPGSTAEFGRMRNVQLNLLEVRLEENSRLLLHRSQLFTARVTLLGNSVIEGDESNPNVGLSRIDFEGLSRTLIPGGFRVRATNGTATVRGTTVHFGVNLAAFDVAGPSTPALAFDAPILDGFGFEKGGGGYLRLSTSNSISGATAKILDGTVEMRSPFALGRAMGTVLRKEIQLAEGGALVLREVSPPDDLTLRVQGDELLPGGGVGSRLFAFGNCTWPGSIQLDTDLFVFANDLNLSGQIAGAGGMRCAFGSVRLSGTTANTFTGQLVLEGDLLELSKPSGVKAYAGPLIVGGPNIATRSEARWLNAYQNIGASLTLHSNALVNLNGFNEDFGPVAFNGGRVETAGGQFAIYAPLTVNASKSTAVINGVLGLPPGQRVFVVEPSDGFCELRINAVVIGNASHVIKRGFGTMCLSSENTYTGLTIVEQGTLDATSADALGSKDSGTIVQVGASLWLNFTGAPFFEPLTIRGPGLTFGWGALNVAGTIDLRSQFPAIFPALELGDDAIINVQSANDQLTITGEIRGNSSLTKIGFGTLALAGNQPNSYTGETSLEQGTLLLNKPTGVTAVPSHLIIGGGIGNLTSASTLVRHTGGFTILGSVTVNRGGLWDLNGFSEGFTVGALEGRPPLTLNDGGDVQTGAGSLFLPVGGDVRVTPGASLTGASTISGHLGLDPGPHRFIVEGGISGLGFDLPELAISAVISQTSTAAEIIKEGAGELRLSADNSFTGPVTVIDGRLTAAHALALGTAGGGVFVNGNASLACVGGIEVQGETLSLNSTNAAALLSLGPGTNTWSGNCILQRTAGVRVPDAHGAFIHAGGNGAATISGTGGIHKSGRGALIIAGLQGGNSYAGPTMVTEGLLEALRRDSLSTNIVVTGASAALRTGRATGLFPARTVLPIGASLTVQNGAEWTMNGTNFEMLSRLQGDGRLVLGSGGGLTVSNTVACEFAGTLSGSSPINKFGPAPLHLTGNSPGYVNLMTVFDGTLQVDGQIPNGPVIVKAGAQLQGDGVLGDVVSESGFVDVLASPRDHPGRQTGDLELGNFNVTGSSVVRLDIFGPQPTGGNDLLITRGGVSLGNASLASGINYAPREGDVITLLRKDSAGPIIGTFSGLPEGAVRTIGGVSVRTTYLGGDGNDFTFTVTNLPIQAGGTELTSGRGGANLVPNDCSQLMLVITNRSGTAINDVHGSLRSLTEGVLVTRAESDFANLSPNARGTNLTPFQIRTEPRFRCDSPAQFELILTSSNLPPMAVLYAIPGSAGHALDFDGSGNFVRVPATTALNPFPFTLALWVNTRQAAGVAGMANKYASASLNGWNLQLRNGHAHAWYYRNSANFVSAGANGLDGGFIADGAWHHLAFTVEPGAGTLYVDGVPQQSVAWTGTPGPPTSGQDLRFGNDAGNGIAFNGQMDEITVWRTALSQSQIQSIKNGNLTGGEAELLAYFRSDEASGNLVADSAPIDGNNHGTWVGTSRFSLSEAPIAPGPGANCQTGGGACESCFSVTGRFDPNASTTSIRLNLTGVPSVCEPAKPCPGFVAASNAPVRHVIHSFTNMTSVALRVTAQLRRDCDGEAALGVAAYSGEFRSSDPCAFYLGDDGGELAPNPPFSFQVPPQTRFLLVVMARSANLACDSYALELFGVPCPVPTLHVTKDTAPEKVRLHWSSAYPEYRLQSADIPVHAGPMTFEDAATVPTLIDGQFVITNAATAPHELFRLKAR